MSIRNIRRSVLVLAAAAVLVAGGIFAGRLLARALPGGRHDHTVPGIFGRITRSLDLTGDQQAQIKGILRSHAPEIEAEMQASSDARRALHEAIMTDPIDEGSIRARAADLARAQADGAVLIARIRTEVYPILSADQRNRFQSYQRKMHGHGDRARQAFERFLNSEKP